MAINTRLPENRSRPNIGTGIFTARIISHLDPAYMGSLEVVLLRSDGNKIGDPTQTYVVRASFPFFGYTPYEFTGNNNNDYNDTQKSYGMWFVPPDIGVTVLCTFVDGDPSQGYWFGCVPGRFTNAMVPGIAATENVDLTEQQRRIYGPSTFLPAAEVNRKATANNTTNNTDAASDRAKRPVHPLADRLLVQGTLSDDVRGITTASARRDIPSMVFGLSTPGPLDYRPNAKRLRVGTLTSQSPNPVPVSRLGGTQFVMDDGDSRYRRRTHASAGPMKYIDMIEHKFTDDGQPTNETGDPTVPYGESVRLRTRTGHQILLHNSEDLIYINNSAGTAWIELTSNGKIDIYARDSVSIHTEADFNFFANRDINLEAGRNLNIKTGGRLKADVAAEYEIIVGASGKITVAETWDHRAGGTMKVSSGGNFDLVASTDFKATVGGSFNVGAVGELVWSGSEAHINGKAPASADLADPATPMPTWPNPVTSVSAGWNRLYQSGTLNSIMKRIPMHEPWALHENQAPGFLSTNQTDRENSGSSTPTTSSPVTSTDTGVLPPPTNPTPRELSERERQAMAYFVGQGWTQFQAAGIVGNLVNESRLNPEAVNRNDAGPGRDSVGIAQWNTGRLEALQAFAASKGTSYTTFQTQLEFVQHELNGTERSAGQRLRAATTVEEATLAMTRYERFYGYEQGYNSPETQRRIASAADINASFTGTA